MRVDLLKVGSAMVERVELHLIFFHEFVRTSSHSTK